MIGASLQRVGAENRVTATDLHLRRQPTPRADTARRTWQHDRALWPYDSVT